MKRVNIYLTEQQMKALARLKAVTGLSVSELVRRAIDRFLEKRMEEQG